MMASLVQGYLHLIEDRDLSQRVESPLVQCHSPLSPHARDGWVTQCSPASHVEVMLRWAERATPWHLYLPECLMPSTHRTGAREPSGTSSGTSLSRSFHHGKDEKDALLSPHTSREVPALCLTGQPQLLWPSELSKACARGGESVGFQVSSCQNLTWDQQSRLQGVQMTVTVDWLQEEETVLRAWAAFITAALLLVCSVFTELRTKHGWSQPMLGAASLWESASISNGFFTPVAPDAPLDPVPQLNNAASVDLNFQINSLTWS